MKIRRTLSRLYRELSLGAVVYKKTDPDTIFLPTLKKIVSGSVFYTKTDPDTIRIGFFIKNRP